MPDPTPDEEIASVMIVDDDLLGLNLLDHLITNLAAFRIVCFSDPLEALAWCATNDPDIVITDFQMPQCSGLELIRRLRQRERTRDVPIMMLTAVEDRQVCYEALQLGANDFLQKPIDAPEVRARMLNMLAIRRGQQALMRRSEALSREVALATEGILARESEMIIRLSKAAEYRDSETGAHILRVAHVARVVAEGVGLKDEELELTFKAAPMHDIGKLGIPDSILHKPGRLDEQEFTVMKQHTTIGHQILKDSNCALIQLAASVALSHHERFDGSGYPNGLAGEAIPLSGRIVAVADVFDALTSARPYKVAWPVDAAVAEVAGAAGTHFDPQCVEAFLAGLDRVTDVRRQFPD